MSSIASGLAIVKKIRRLDGIAIIQAGNFSYQDLPFDEENCEQFRLEVLDMFQSYSAEGKVPRKMVLGDESRSIMLINQKTVILVMVYSKRSSTPMVEKSCELFLDQFADELDLPAGEKNRPPSPAQPPAPTGPSWAEFQSDLEEMLTKVMASGQAQKMIERQLEDEGLSATDELSSDKFQAFGTALLSNVRDKSLAKMLTLELEHLLSGK